MENLKFVVWGSNTGVDKVQGKFDTLRKAQNYARKLSENTLKYTSVSHEGHTVAGYMEGMKRI